MARIVVSGLTNLETTVAIEQFPIPYFPVRYPFHGVQSTVSGVGFNVAKALSCLGDDVRFFTILGDDPAGKICRDVIREEGLRDSLLTTGSGATAQSVILVEPQGRRQIHVDLKNLQDELPPQVSVAKAISKCDVAVLCNINFSRPLLSVARHDGKLIATDVHAVSSLDDPYNLEFMQAAGILFMSHELLPVPPGDWAAEVIGRFGTTVVVVGLGSEGALLRVKGEPDSVFFPVVSTRPVANTIGGGDALFSCFVHFFARGLTPREALARAMVFASYKVGANGGAEGFLTGDELEKMWNARGGGHGG